MLTSLFSVCLCCSLCISLCLCFSQYLCFSMCLCLSQMSLCLSVSLILSASACLISWCLFLSLFSVCVSVCLYVCVFLFLGLFVSVFLSCLSLGLWMTLSLSPSCLSVCWFLFFSECLFLSVSLSPPPCFPASLPASVSLCICFLCLSFLCFCLSLLCYLCISSHLHISLFSSVFPSLSLSFPVPHSLCHLHCLWVSLALHSSPSICYRLHLPHPSLTSGEEVGRHNLPLHNGGTLNPM